ICFAVMMLDGQCWSHVNNTCAGSWGVGCLAGGGSSANVKVSSVGIEVFLRLFDRERRNLLVEDQFLIGAKVDVDNDPLRGVAGSFARLSRGPDLASRFNTVARRGGL